MEKRLKKHLPGGTFKNVPPARSRTMKAIRGHNNKTTELRFKMALVRACIKGWRMRPKELAGRPDFFFPAQNLAVFIDGCFWHGCPKCGHFPKTNASFWKAKIMRNRERDAEVTRKLEAEGIEVVRFWEHEVGTSLEECVHELRKRMNR